jgi:hypothetical protein
MTKKFLLVFAVLLVMGSLAVAQTYGESQSTTSAPSTTNSMQTNDSAMGQQASDNNAAAEQTDPDSTNFTHQDFRGTELEKAYQQFDKSGRSDCSAIRATGCDQGGGGS